jgi:3D (Asp-Asp-Asp) domain-containing protein
MTIKQKIGIFFICRFIGIGILFFTLKDGIGNGIVSLEKTGIFTAYTAIVPQTDSTPTITASSQKVREGVVANNCLPFGTRIKVNNRIYEIQDRMNEKYRCDNFDIFIWKHSEAIGFGRQTLKYEII